MRKGYTCTDVGTSHQGSDVESRSPTRQAGISYLMSVSLPQLGVAGTVSAHMFLKCAITGRCRTDKPVLHKSLVLDFGLEG